MFPAMCVCVFACVSDVEAIASSCERLALVESSDILQNDNRRILSINKAATFKPIVSANRAV